MRLFPVKAHLSKKEYKAESQKNDAKDDWNDLYQIGER